MFRGGCHCRRVQYQVRASPQRLLVCNCSICKMKGYLHWIVARGDFELVRGTEELATYTFNTGTAQHYFCRHCGIASFYVPRSDPDKIDVNARCVEGLDLESIAVEHFDGRNWEAHYEIYRQS